MLSLFLRKKASPTTSVPLAPAVELPKGLTQPESATSLLGTPRRLKLLEHIWQRTSVSRQQYVTLYRVPLERYAELVQQLPASENHHHAWPGGMLDHGLEIVAYALKLRQSHLLPAGATPEAQAAQAEAWTAGIAYAALLHDIGKIAVDLHVEYADGTVWHPWHGPLQRPYRFRYRKEREYRLHGAATGLLYTHILASATLDWLSGYPDLWPALLYVLAGQYEHAGMLGELVRQADQASVAQALGGDPGKARLAPREALQRKLLDGLRYLLKEEFRLNQPQASDGWLTEDALWLVSKTVSDKLRAHLLAHGIEGIPSSNTAVFDVLQDHGIAQATPEGKAIWRATVTSESGWSHSFTFLKLAPALIWEPDARPAPFRGSVRMDGDTSPGAGDGSPMTSTPSPNSPQVSQVSETTQPAATAHPPARTPDGIDALIELLHQDTSLSANSPTSASDSSSEIAVSVEDEILARPIPPSSATHSHHEPTIMDWLRQGIQSRKLIINDAKALVHTVANTAYLVSPGVFQRYAQEHPQIGATAKQEGLQGWQWVQKRFERQHLHRKQPNGLNIWTCEVEGPRKTRRLHGYLLDEPSLLFDVLPANNPYLRLADCSTETET